MQVLHCNKCINLVGGVDNGGGYTCGGRDTRKIFLFFPQFCSSKQNKVNKRQKKKTKNTKPNKIVNLNSHE